MQNIHRWPAAIFYTVIFFLLVLPYTLNLWWKFLPSVILIVVLTKGRSPSWLDDLGLRMTTRYVAIGAATLIATFIVANLLIQHIAELASFYIFSDERWHLGWRFTPLSQAFAEELVLRAMLLLGLLSIMTSRIKVSLIAALLFVVWHLVFFPLAQGVWLTPLTLATLFFFGYAANNFFLTTRNIAIPFGLHAGWNLVKFSGDYYYLGTSSRMTEAEAFNHIEGSPLVLVLALGLAVFSEILAIRQFNHHSRRV